MKVLPFKIPKSKRQSFLYQEDKTQCFYDRLHQHEEIQISIILKGEGTFIIGDSITNYKINDIFIIGSNIPHVFKSYIEDKKESFMISVFFNQNSFGEDFFRLDELRCLDNLFNKSKYGIKLLSNKLELKNIFLQLKNTNDLKSLIFLLEILQIACYSKAKLLSTFINKKSYNDNESKRISDVYKYTINNYQRHISLEQISNIANMTSTAFCRYFKQRTNKTFFQFLTGLRIENACKLLSKNNDLTIAEIAYKSGFKNISNFNRQFKSNKKISPVKYKAEKFNFKFSIK